MTLEFMCVALEIFREKKIFAVEYLLPFYLHGLLPAPPNPPLTTPDLPCLLDFPILFLDFFLIVLKVQFSISKIFFYRNRLSQTKWFHTM
jgi:hypothetical protein